MRDGRTIMRYIAIIVVCLTALLFAFCFWPTLYRYESSGLSQGVSLLVRIHRVSGDTEFFFLGAWHRAKPASEWRQSISAYKGITTESLQALSPKTPDDPVLTPGFVPDDEYPGVIFDDGFVPDDPAITPGLVVDDGFVPDDEADDGVPPGARFLDEEEPPK